MYLVFDIGGTNLRLAVSSDQKTIFQSKILPTTQNFLTAIETIKQEVKTLSNGGLIEKIAGGIAGPLNKEKTMLAASPHIPDWIGQPLKEKLEQTFHCPVVLENDVALAGLGEASKGIGVGKKIIAYINIGTGVGGVRINNGEIDENSLGFEPGHQVIIADGKLCNCGGKGHLEAYIGGSYIEKAYFQKAADLKDSQDWDQIAKYLSIGLNNTIVHWSPDIVILGGSVVKSLSLESIRSHLKNELTIFPQPPQIVLAQLGDKAGLYGALELLK